MNHDARRAWTYDQIRRQEPKRRRTDAKAVDSRSCSCYYFFPNDVGQDQFVCKKFFLHTLGYKSDKVITTLLNATSLSQMAPRADMRGRHELSNKLSGDMSASIKAHIESFHPAVSHYRREHAPLRRYLPPELTVLEMYQDFSKKHSGVSCCYQTYRKMVASMNISFAKLGEEECEECKLHDKHRHVEVAASGNEDLEQSPSPCTECDQWKAHIERARISRKHYQDDADKIKDPKEVYFSVDMQKIIMLPRLPGVKTCVFTRRLVAFHETFAPLGSKVNSGKNKQPVISVVWHEGMSGRNADDVASAYAKVIRSAEMRDFKQFIFYVDNCSAQNKNWTLFTCMTAEVNRGAGPDQITMRFLEKGHTFMSADSYHAQVESAMRKMKNLYDFGDFQSAVARYGAKVLTMEVNDFVLWENGMSTAKFTKKPNLSDVQEIQFRKGETKLFWKKNMDDAEYEEGEFLKKKTAAHIQREVPYQSAQMPRGITTRKKDELRSKLCPLMPVNRREFWNSLVVNDESADLIDS